MPKATHKDNLKDHEQKFDKNNLLTRGQTIKNISLNETDPIITIIGLPPAGGCVTFNKIINITPKPTATGILRKIGKGTKFKKIIPIKAVKKCPKIIFFGCAKGLSG